MISSCILPIRKATKLKEYNLKNASYSGKSKEQFIVEQLIKGPQKGKYTATLTSDTELYKCCNSRKHMLCGFWRQFLNGTEYGFQQACNILNRKFFIGT